MCLLSILILEFLILELGHNPLLFRDACVNYLPIISIIIVRIKSELILLILHNYGVGQIVI